jgi:diguanylate cyclase (GGDEF)-like protein/putative nucleotidyltransferase with HDIG domain/PAS domain S-box-containing protein
VPAFPDEIALDMADNAITNPFSPANFADASVTVAARNVVDRTAEVESLLQSLDEAAARSGRSATGALTDANETRLVHARLGIASGLHTALRCRDPATASHCVRVALGCSSWAAVMELDLVERDALEVAALLHDVGKIGVPDKVLRKPGRLTPEESESMARHTAMTIEILASCDASQDILDIVRFARARFDGKAPNQEIVGNGLPQAARMLSIVDAFDSMTTDHVYRPARSRERAIAELFQCAGGQFDPELVRKFSELFAQDQNLLTEKLARHWLRDLAHDPAELPWDGSSSGYTGIPTSSSPMPLFEKMLIDNMHDGVLFVDADCRIVLWNTGIERLTGVSCQAAFGRMFLPSLLDMYNNHQARIPDDECPVARSIQSGVQSIGRVNVMGRQGRHVAVDLHTIPVRRSDGVMQGATVLLHDASSETSLEERCQALHLQVSKDPLTQVANRAEFDRMLVNFVAAHQESNLPCSLIMSDIDHFKNINDKFGHQAGDAAIITFAALLKSMCRSGDLVARYGGEEFAILCADCNNASAARKAELIRRRLAELKHTYLGQKCITASFGVTELQTGDTPETMLRRADRALLQAKDQGRNQVVQLGGGMSGETEKKSWWPFHAWTGRALVEARLKTAVPLEIAVQKLRGFVSDQNAKILSTKQNEMSMELTDRLSTANRRKTDREVAFTITLRFSEQHVQRANSHGLTAGEYVETHVDVTIHPRRDRDRRHDTTIAKARGLLGSLKSYLIAIEHEGRLPEPLAEVVVTTEQT